MEIPNRTQEVSRRPASPMGNVVVVDEDYADMCEYCQLLQQAGYTVRCCSSYTEGKACLDSRTASFVIVSQGGPAFEGREVLQRAIEKDRHTPVLVLTRAVNMSCYLEAIQLGAFDYLQKPLKAEEILGLVSAHIRGRSQAAQRV
jgi:DNA-binding NtrC family response regulator